MCIKEHFLELDMVTHSWEVVGVRWVIAQQLKAVVPRPHQGWCCTGMGACPYGTIKGLHCRRLHVGLKVEGTSAPTAEEESLIRTAVRFGSLPCRTASYCTWLRGPPRELCAVRIL